MIYIIGAGWYGCHIALELLKTQNTHKHEIRELASKSTDSPDKNVAIKSQHSSLEIRLVDKANAFFTGSSARNQNRLHLGYHYPRSQETIEECRKGFAEFKATYPTLSTHIPNNLYLIASESRTSADEFSRRFDHPGELLCIEGRTPFSRIRGTKATMFQVDEEYIDNEAAALYFWDLLSPHFLQVDNPQAFESIERLRCVLGVMDGDWIINCTYNQLDPIPMDHYELYCSLVYRIPGNLFALTLMDGPYFSIYPYNLEKQLYTVTSVRNGPIWRGTNLLEAPAWSTNLEESVRSLVEAEVAAALPEFPTLASYHSAFLSWKTKPVTEEDDRSLRHHVGNRVISLYGGKITGMFQAARVVKEVIGIE